jgi:hypothetical protein
MKETTMNLNKEEQQFIAENITRYDVVTNLTVDNIEIRIHGKAHGGSGSTALYRTANVADIYRAKIKKFGSWDKYLKSEGKTYKAFDPDGWMINTEAGKEL